jgi:integrase
VKSVQAMLGHATADMTLNRYAMWFPEDLDVLRNRLDEAYKQAQSARHSK